MGFAIRVRQKAGRDEIFTGPDREQHDTREDKHAFQLHMPSLDRARVAAGHEMINRSSEGPRSTVQSLVGKLRSSLPPFTRTARRQEVGA